MRKKKLLKNTIASITFEVTTLICGFILPRLILRYYGSQVNGLVNSITQFLQIIALFDMGVGAVVQSTLYKPLAENDNGLISKIVKSAKRFFDFFTIGHFEKSRGYNKKTFVERLLSEREREWNVSLFDVL